MTNGKKRQMKLETSCTILFTPVGFRAAPPQATSRTFFWLLWLLLCGTRGEGQGRELRDRRPRLCPSPLLPGPRRGKQVERGCVFLWRHQRNRCQAQRQACTWSASPFHRETLAQHFCLLVNFHNLRNRRKCLFPSFVNKRIRAQRNQSSVPRITGPAGQSCGDLLSNGLYALILCVLSLRCCVSGPGEGQGGRRVLHCHENSRSK